MSKRGLSLAGINAKRAKLEQSVGGSGGGGGSGGSGGEGSNPFLSRPIEKPQNAIQKFLLQVRTEARNYLPSELRKGGGPIDKPFCEVEARLGLLKVLHAQPSRRVTSTGNKRYPVYDCTGLPTSMSSGVSRGMYFKTSGAGISEVSPISHALGVSVVEKLKLDLVESEMVETVYTGYANEGRCCFPGEHDENNTTAIGKMESKAKLSTLDLTVPSANYDIRINLSSEKIMDPCIRGQPPPGWKSKRIKRRRSYSKRDKKIVWQIDITEVTTTTTNNNSNSSKTSVDYEIEMELRDVVLLQFINETNDQMAARMSADLSNQLWWILQQINPLHEALDVEDYIRDHPNKKAVALAQAQCGAFLKFMSSGGQNAKFESPIARPNETPSASLSNVKFIGCMPVNFSRHNIDEIQRSADNAYYLSEKTDGVRYLMIFTGDTVVLLDRKMCGKQIIPTNSDSGNGSNGSSEPMASVLDLIKPGTVFDGEVVMNRKTGRKPRPIYIVFDVLSISTTQPILHLPFEQRKKHLFQATFRTPTANRDMFADVRSFVSSTDALPLVRKNFVKRTELDNLLRHVSEERGLRTYNNGELHNHLTDGIIFQPNLPYVCGTDVNLLKWKYIDTVTIDIELLDQHQLPHHQRGGHGDDDEDGNGTLHVGCLGEEQTRVDMTRYVQLPASERLRLEADRFYDSTSSSPLRIAEVGFHPETGEWYYLKMRSDKVTPNHISTVLGTLLELAESLTTDELRYRMSVPPGTRDTYRKEMRGMLKGLLDHQRKRNAATNTATAASGSSSSQHK